MKRWMWLVLAALMAGGVLAGGWTATYPLAGGTVGLTNTQANSSWVPVSVMWRFGGPGTGTAQVWRVSQDVSFLLAYRAFTNVTTVVWVPDADYTFGLGDALVIQSSVTGGVVQVIRKGD